MSEVRGERPEAQGPARSADAVAEFIGQLQELRRGAGHPSYRELSGRSGISKSRVADVLSGHSFPKWEATKALVIACGAEHDLDKWKHAWEAAVIARAEYSHVSGNSDREETNRYIVNLSSQAVRALEILTDGDRAKVNDVIGRALKLYQYMSDASSEGHEINLVKPGGPPERIVIL